MFMVLIVGALNMGWMVGERPGGGLDSGRGIGNGSIGEKGE